MVKNKKGGKNGKKIARKHQTEEKQQRFLRLSKDSAEKYAIVDTIYGNGMCNVMCCDGIERLCIIRRKFKGRGKRDNFVSIGKLLLVGVREWEVVKSNKKPKCDLLEVYDNREIERLQQKNIEGLSTLLTKFVKDDEDDVVEFVDNDTNNYENMLESMSKTDTKKFKIDSVEIDIDEI